MRNIRVFPSCFLRVMAVFCAFFGALTVTYNAHAACSPGIPCVTNFTPNDPDDPSDGPNASGEPNAVKSGSAACDADFMNQIYARSFLEYSREMMLSQTVVRKPDSVLEYSCYDQAVKDLADYAGPIFTESTRWQGVTVSNPGADDINLNVYMGATKLDTSLNSLVMASLNSFVDSNFSHDFLGGAAAGENNSIASSVSGAGSSCAFMDGLFFLSRCKNFGTDDLFATFDELKSLDPRQLPPSYAACTNPITEDIIKVAGNRNFQYVAYDKVNTFLDYLTGTACKPPIATGVQVTQDKYNTNSAGVSTLVSSSSFPDRICPNPGCYFNGTTCAP